MKCRSYCVTLESDTVVSQRNATSGDHKSLPYLPGATFLGACAGHLYSDLGGQAWNSFHSGKVRFHNALPLDGSGCPGFPMPLAFFRTKYPQNDIDAQETYNLARQTWSLKGLQPKQRRDGFLCGDGAEIKPTRAFRLKTAIDRDKGFRATDSQLFGYQFLAAGSRWYLQIDFDADIAEALINSISDYLVDGSIRIGRSRSAEFGQVRIETLENPLDLPTTPDGNKRLVVYCLSDLALRDPETGIPTLQPTTDLLGLPEGKLLPEFSYLRFRNYAPFNAYRGANDLERQVIVAGSVITFQLNDELNKKDLEQRQQQLSAAVGDYRQDGLGQLWLNPSFLSGDTFVPMEISSLITSDQTDQTLNSDQNKLVGWLSQSSDEEVLTQIAQTHALTWLNEIKLVKGGPTCSQWRELTLRAQKSTDLEPLRGELFAEKTGLCSYGVSAKQWQQEYRFGQSYSDWLRALLNPDETDFIGAALLSRSLAHFGRLAASRLRQEGK